MNDPRVEKLAGVIVDYSIGVRKGERVLLQGNAVCAPLLRSIYGRVLKAGGYPLTMVQLPGMSETFFRNANDEQLSYVHEPLKMLMETYDAGITVMGSYNTKALTNVEPSRMVMASRSQSALLRIMMDRLSEGSFRWVGTQFPTPSNAQDAEMSLTDYEELIYGACLPDEDDPVGYWKRFSQWQDRIVDWLQGKKEIRVTAEGTDLRLSVHGRSFMNCDGRMNMPDGEVCTSPVENSADGHVLINYPTIYQGREFTGVRLWFEGGRVVKATAHKGEAMLNEILDTDAGSRYLGEFAIGTNQGIKCFTGSILLDEKIGGSFHIALGMGLPETGGENTSAIHWDMVSDLRNGGTIFVDGELVYKDGSFTVDF